MTDKQVSELWSDEAIARTLGRRHLDYSLRTALDALKEARAEIERLRELLRDCRVASRIQDWETRCKEIDDMVRHALAGEEAKP